MIYIVSNTFLYFRLQWWWLLAASANNRSVWSRKMNKPRLMLTASTLQRSLKIASLDTHARLNNLPPSSTISIIKKNLINLAPCNLKWFPSIRYLALCAHIWDCYSVILLRGEGESLDTDNYSSLLGVGVNIRIMVIPWLITILINDHEVGESFIIHSTPLLPLDINL